MCDLARFDRSHVGGIESHYRNGIAGKCCKLNLIACTLVMHQNDSANITSSQSLRRQIMLQYDEVHFMAHDHPASVTGHRSHIWYRSGFGVMQ